MYLKYVVYRLRSLYSYTSKFILFNFYSRITLTPGMRERMNERAAAMAAANQARVSASPAVAVSTPAPVVNNGSSPAKKPVLTVTGPSILQQTLR